ncbi:MAG: hypothetical protein WCQ23_07500 [Candidatus Methanomethylophilaceae archaeon]
MKSVFKRLNLRSKNKIFNGRYDALKAVHEILWDYTDLGDSDGIMVTITPDGNYITKSDLGCWVPMSNDGLTQTMAADAFMEGVSCDGVETGGWRSGPPVHSSYETLTGQGKGKWHVDDPELLNLFAIITKGISDAAREGCVVHIVYYDGRIEDAVVFNSEKEISRYVREKKDNDSI